MPAISIKVPCAEFGRQFTVGQYVADLFTAQTVAMVSSGLADYDPSSGINLSLPSDLTTPVPITSVQFANPAAFGMNRPDGRVYLFAGQRLNWDGAQLSPGSGACGVWITGQRLLGATVTARVIGGAATGLQWYRDGVAISGATSTTYTLVAADVAANVVVSCRATGFVPEGRLMY